MKTEETQHAPQVLSEDLDLRGPTSIHRAVKLAGRYVGGTEELIARMRPGAVSLDFLRSGKKAKRFTLDAAEADAFAEAWLDFKHDLAAAQEAERRRLHDVLEEARQLAEPLGGMITPSHGDSSDADLDAVYDLTMPSPWRHWSTSYAPLDVVLARVQRACAAIKEDAEATLSDSEATRPGGRNE
ncbi:MAG: hypothetical protein H0W02_10245 [Ktedonobacteraceae bacterium]|nr:hypothetical protein [Ktedonobacteraceae bacterium]